MDVSRCQDIQDSRPPPVTMIMITVSDTDGAMATVAIRWKARIPQMSASKSGFALSLPVPGSHASAQNHNPFIKKTCAENVLCSQAKQHLGERAEQTLDTESTARLELTYHLLITTSQQSGPTRGNSSRHVRPSPLTTQVTHPAISEEG